MKHVFVTLKYNVKLPLSKKYPTKQNYFKIKYRTFKQYE